MIKQKITYEYKVIEIIDQDGKIDVQNLSDKLNELGTQGWHLVSAYSNELGKMAVSVLGIGLNSTADQNILIFERAIDENEDEYEERLKKYNKEKEIKQENSIKNEQLIQDKNQQTINEYAQQQLENTDKSDIYKLQEMYFNTSSLSFMKETVPDICLFDEIEDYKNALKKLIK